MFDMPSGSEQRSSTNGNKDTPKSSENFGDDLGMISGCATPDLAMLRWIAYIKSLNLEIRHIGGKENAMVDMLSRARFKNESDMVSEDEDVC